MRSTISMIFGAMLLSAGAAGAQERFPFVKSSETIDFSSADAGPKFEQLVRDASSTPLIYLDWHFANFTSNEVFERLKPDDAGDDGDGAVCALLYDGDEELVASGRPDRENNHLLAAFDLWPDGVDPFTTATCEYFGSAPAQGLRIRGFYYVADIRTATAENYSFRPLEVEATNIPAGFLNSAP